VELKAQKRKGSNSKAKISDRNNEELLEEVKGGEKYQDPFQLQIGQDRVN